MKKQQNAAPMIVLGSTFRLRDLELGERDTYTLTRPSDADIRHNRISTLTPLGKAIYGRQPGEVVDVEAPGGMFRFEIEAIK